MELFQICDYAPLEAMTDAELEAVRATADRLGIALELGTKGIRPEHLRKFLHIAGILGAPLLRTMFNVPGHTPRRRRKRWRSSRRCCRSSRRPG